MKAKLLPTTVVGSYPQPGWLVDRDYLATRVPRVRAHEMWRVDAAALEEAQDDATRLAIADMERAGIDIISDGEMRRESYSNRFGTALSGIDIDNPAETRGRGDYTVPVPRVVGPIRRTRPVEVRDVEFLRANTDRTIKITIPGPFTLSQQCVNEYYPDEESVALAYADAVNAEIRDLFAAGVDIVQLDEPWVQSRHEKAKDFAVRAIDRALEGATGQTVVHLCFGYAAVVSNKPSGYSFLPELDSCAADQVSIEAAQPRLDLSILQALPSKQIMVGVIDLGDKAVETPDIVAGRIRAALDHVAAERLVIAPDCGMKYLPRDVAFGKLKAMAEGAAIVRSELGG